MRDLGKIRSKGQVMSKTTKSRATGQNRPWVPAWRGLTTGTASSEAEQNPELPDTASPETEQCTGLLRGLGIVGWDALEPVVLAALASEAPILLVGSHGTAKSLLLERLADALGLNFRHYNASILNFDDLVGFPVPDGDRVRYLRTPLDAWDAEAIFIDEISRCRPDLQNRLFPLVHERRLQGERIEHLRFRWAAMNPPPSPDEPLEDAAYSGSEPLDTALADRFPWVIEVPARLSEADRLTVIRGGAEGVADVEALRNAVAGIRSRLARAERAYREGAGTYVSAAAHALERTNPELALSNRRLRMIYQGIVALIATGSYENKADAALAGLTWSLPQRARGPVPGEAILAAHAIARSLLAWPKDADIRVRLLAERDPIERAALALEQQNPELTVATLLDAHAGLEPAKRLAFSAWLFPYLAEAKPDLGGILFEALGADLGRVHANHETTLRVNHNDPRLRAVDEISRIASTLAAEEAWIEDVLWAALREFPPQSGNRFVPQALTAFAQHLSTRIPRVAPAADADQADQGAVA